MWKSTNLSNKVQKHQGFFNRLRISWAVLSYQQKHERVVVLANEENLIPFNERSESEQREIARQGGIASGVARRRKRSMKEAADLYLSLPVSDKRKFNKAARRYVDINDIDNQMLMIMGLVDAATDGDARAGKLIADLIGEGAPKEDAERDQLARAAELLGGLDSVID